MRLLKGHTILIAFFLLIPTTGNCVPNDQQTLTTYIDSNAHFDRVIARLTPYKKENNNPHQTQLNFQGRNFQTANFQTNSSRQLSLTTEIILTSLQALESTINDVAFTAAALDQDDVNDILESVYGEALYHSQDIRG
jgi:hypothetical protein